jgi:hypothetical protein
VFLLVLDRQPEVARRSGARLLDEPMQQNHSLPRIHVEQNARDSVVAQVRPHLVDSALQWSAQRQTQRPPELNGFDVSSYGLFVSIRQAL